jgi:hypothetical protein
MFIVKNLVNPVNDCLTALASQKVHCSPQFFVFLHRPPIATAFACPSSNLLKQCDFVEHCLKVSHRYVSFSAFPRDRVPRKHAVKATATRAWHKV